MNVDVSISLLNAYLRHVYTQANGFGRIANFGTSSHVLTGLSRV